MSILKIKLKFNFFLFEGTLKYGTCMLIMMFKSSCFTENLGVIIFFLNLQLIIWKIKRKKKKMKNNKSKKKNYKNLNASDTNIILQEKEDKEVDFSPIISNKKRKNDIEEKNNDQKKKLRNENLSESIFVWGEGIGGQLGMGEEITRINNPTKIDSLKDIVVDSVACGAEHTLASFSGSSDLFTWGNDEYSQV